MPFKIKFNPTAFKAASLAVGKDETRPALKCVRLEKTEKSTLWIATCGRILVVINDDAQPEIEAGGKELKVNLPVPDFSVVLRGCGKIKELSVCGDDAKIIYSGERFSQTMGACSLVYPDWRSVIPEAKAEAVNCFSINPKYLETCKSIFDTLGSRENGVFISHYGGRHSPIRILSPTEEICEKVFCVVMPMHLNGEFKSHTTNPSWL